ncbi:MAG: Ni/Fe hydrogenase subunit alpha [Anaerolineaceae bacterium]|nr:Ni/Fe hydrogenase subunit alpha [Anaerolineaceae bacterium]
MTQKIQIDPITRLEGHARVDLFLNDDGNLENAYLVIPELRGFEKFCEGRPVEEMPRITQRTCGVCPIAHHMASAKAGDAVYQVTPPPTALKLRELMYSAFFVADHATHFYILGGPDFIVGPDAMKSERNILGVVKKVGKEVGAQVMQLLRDNHEITAMIGGRYIHSVGAIIGGVSKPITEEQRQSIVERAQRSVEFAKVSLGLFDKIVMGNKAYVDMILSDSFAHKTYYMGMVDKNDNVNFYDGEIKVVDPDGNEFVRFTPDEYLDVISEHIEPWTYLKFTYLKKVGWKGLVDGKDSGVYRASPLSRLNVAKGMATPAAQAEYERYFETLGGKPVHSTLATHWARLIETLYAAERSLELAQDEEITSSNVRTIPTEKPVRGVGITEAPRGTLIHDYTPDENGMISSMNLIVGTTNNYAAMDMSVKKAAEGLIKAGEPVSETALNKIEMAFRAYDPCIGCATHAQPGETPLLLNIYDHDHNLIDTVQRD